MKRTANRYWSIPHLSTSRLGSKDRFIEPRQERIITTERRDRHDVIIATEKYDGCNVSVIMINGKLEALTRSGYLCRQSEWPVHIQFYNWVCGNLQRFRDALQEGERIVGEWLGTTHSLEYSYTDPFIAIDKIDKNGLHLGFDSLEDVFYTPRVLHRGGPVNPKDLQEALSKHDESGLPICLTVPEGIVFTVIRDEKVIIRAKWVRHDFVNQVPI
jgi:hypothetical protein